MLENGENFGVAVCIFDCNDLKVINDKYGHDKGDDYIKNACHYICTTFRRSAVFRIGGDEFSAVMMNDDFASRDELIARFHSEQEATAVMQKIRGTSCTSRSALPFMTLKATGPSKIRSRERTI